MKTSSTDIRQIEKYLTHQLSPGETLLFTARLVLNPALKQTLTLHQKTLTLIKAYTRNQQRRHLNNIHNQLFSNPEKTSFTHQIHQIFHKG